MSWFRHDWITVMLFLQFSVKPLLNDCTWFKMPLLGFWLSPQDFKHRLQLWWSYTDFLCISDCNLKWFYWHGKLLSQTSTPLYLRVFASICLCQVLEVLWSGSSNSSLQKKWRQSKSFELRSMNSIVPFKGQLKNYVFNVPFLNCLLYILMYFWLHEALCNSFILKGALLITVKAEMDSKTFSRLKTYQ